MSDDEQRKRVLALMPAGRKDEEPAGRFFAVDRRTWARVCGLGMYPALAYLVLACGTGRDHATTSWSAKAMHTHTTASRAQASKAIDVLVTQGLVTREQAGKHPHYKVRAWSDLAGEPGAAENIWLPNELVTGTEKGEASPIERVRQTHDVLLLRLLVDLYCGHDLPGEGGVPRTVVYGGYTREKLGEHGELIVWGFRRQPRTVTKSDGAVVPHLRATDASHASDPRDFFARLRVLETLGLIQEVTYLCDGPEGSIMHPLGVRPAGAGDAENEIGHAAARASAAMLVPSKQGFEPVTFAVPVRKHLAQVTALAIFRLRYLPWTNLTREWQPEYRSTCAHWLEQYAAMAVRGERSGAGLGWPEAATA